MGNKETSERRLNKDDFEKLPESPPGAIIPSKTRKSFLKIISDNSPTKTEKIFQIHISNWKRSDCITFLKILDSRFKECPYEKYYIKHFSYCTAIPFMFNYNKQKKIVLNGRNLFTLKESTLRYYFTLRFEEFNILKNDEEEKMNHYIERYIFYHKLIRLYKGLNRGWFVIEFKLLNSYVRSYKVLGKLKKTRKFDNDEGHEPIYQKDEYKDVRKYNEFVQSICDVQTIYKKVVSDLKRIKSTQLKLSLIISDTDYSERLKLKSSKSLKDKFMSLITMRQRYGAYHSSIMIGSLFVHFTTSEIIKLRYGESRNSIFSFEIKKIPVNWEENSELQKMLLPVIKTMVKWNLLGTYSCEYFVKSSLLSPFCKFSGNCQRFCDDCLYQIRKELKLSSEKKLFQTKERNDLFKTIVRQLKRGVFNNEIHFKGENFHILQKMIMKLKEKDVKDYTYPSIDQSYFWNLCLMFKKAHERGDKDIYIQFDDHEQLDNFCWILKEIQYQTKNHRVIDTNNNESSEHDSIYYLLKAMDRGFWLRRERERSQILNNNKKKNNDEVKENNENKTSLLNDAYFNDLMGIDSNMSVSNVISIEEFSSRNKPKEVNIKGKKVVDCPFGDPLEGTLSYNMLRDFEE